eukprot:s144_g28.t2
MLLPRRSVDVPQIQYEDQVVQVPLAKQVHVPMIQEIERTVEVPQVEYVDNVVQVPVEKQVHVPMIQKIEKTVEIPQIEYVDNHVHIPIQKQRHVPVHVPVERPVEVNVIETLEKVIDVPVVKQVEVPQVQTIEKIVEVPFVQVVEKVVEVPQVGSTTQGSVREVDVETEPTRQEEPAQVVQQVIAGTPYPVEHAAPEVIGASPVPTQTEDAPVAERLSRRGDGSDGSGADGWLGPSPFLGVWRRKKVSPGFWTPKTRELKEAFPCPWLTEGPLLASNRGLRVGKTMIDFIWFLDNAPGK